MRRPTDVAPGGAQRVRRLCDNSVEWMKCAAGALECGSLLPLSLSELARGGLDFHRGLGQQAGLQKSGSKLPHSKARCYAGLAKLRRESR